MGARVFRSVARITAKLAFRYLDVSALPIVDDFHCARQLPQLVTDASRHCGRDAERLVDTAEIAVHEIDRQRVAVVFHLRGKRIGEPIEAAKAHADMARPYVKLKRAGNSN